MKLNHILRQLKRCVFCGGHTIHELGCPKVKEDYNHFLGNDSKIGLKRKTLQSGTVVLGAEILGQILRLGSTMILARLLLPEDFGLLAMVTALTIFAERFKDLGLSDATVQAREITHAQASGLFWINFVVCIVIALIFSFLSKPIAWFYAEPRLLVVSLIIASTFIFSGLVIQHQAILRRTLHFGTIATINICSIGLSVLLAIILAYQGFGYWSLVIREFSRAVFVFIGTWLACPWRPALPSHNAPISHFLSFGKNVTGFNLIYFLSQSIDKILLGRLQGPYWVGVYTNASLLLTLPINQLQTPLMTVGLPVLSILQSEPSAFRTSFEKMIQFLTFFSMPVVLFLALFGDVVVFLILGNKWLNAVPLFRVFAVGAFVAPLVHTAGLAMVAVGRTKEYFKMGLINAIFLLLCITIGSFWGVMGITTGYSLSIYIALAVCLLYGFPQTPVRVIPMLRRIAPNLFYSLLTAIIFLYIRIAIGWNFPPPLLVVFILTGIITYFCLWSINHEGRIILRSYWRYAISVLIKKQE